MPINIDPIGHFFAWVDGPPNSTLLNTGQEDVTVRHSRQGEVGKGLSESFDENHARHDGEVWKMALEKILVGTECSLTDRR